MDNTDANKFTEHNTMNTRNMKTIRRSVLRSKVQVTYYMFFESVSASALWPGCSFLMFFINKESCYIG